MNKSIHNIILISGLCSVIIFLPISTIKSQTTDSNNDPGARWGHVLIHDPANNNLLLFGGKKKRGGDYLSDTWVWQDFTWKRKDTQGPSPRGFCAITFHKGRNTILLHGGRGNKNMSYSDLWEWDGMNWHQLEKASGLKADHHQMVYVEGQNGILAFGGWNGKEVLGDTWFWSDNWEKLSISSPPKRASFSMIFNEKRKSVMLYGGLWINGQYADIWEWENHKWQSLSGPYDNSSLDHHTMIYDKNFDQVIGFGGKNYRYTFQNVTFKVAEGKIQEIDIESPSPRHSFGFTFESSKKCGYLYGGKALVNGEQLPLDDFWKWEGNKWHKILKTNGYKH